MGKDEDIEIVGTIRHLNLDVTGTSMFNFVAGGGGGSGWGGGGGCSSAFFHHPQSRLVAVVVEVKNKSKTLCDYF